MLVVLFVLSSLLRLHAQQASIEFITQYATSVIQISQFSQTYNGTVIPIAFEPIYSSDPVFDGAIIRSAPIVVARHHTLSVDLEAATTILQNDPLSSKGVLHARVEVVDAETNVVLWTQTGINLYLRSAEPGTDTNTTQNLTIDLSNMHVKSVILRVTGTCMFGHVPAPRVSINNTLSKEVDEVR